MIALVANTPAVTAISFFIGNSLDFIFAAPGPARAAETSALGTPNNRRGP
jgi:hypothetical protein